jgi:CubicO group peptidase (beta-lactamase class C family)
VDALAQVGTWPVANAAVAVVRVGVGGTGEAGAAGPAADVAGLPGGAGASGAAGVVDVVGDPARSFRLASVSKLLTAYAALIAVEEGVFDLDEPAGPPGSTVAHLLAHASGLAFADARPLAPPGRRRTYSNAGFDVLGAALQAGSGIGMADYLAAAVFEPLGMESSALRGSPAHGVWSSLRDMTRFAAELLAPTLIAPQTFAAATTVAFPGLSGVLPGFGLQDPNDWGLGFEIRDGKDPHWTGSRNSPATFGHFGRSGTFLWVDPAAGAAVVGLTDRDFGPWAAAWPALSDAVLAELAHPADPADPAVPGTPATTG